MYVSLTVAQSSFNEEQEPMNGVSAGDTEDLSQLLLRLLVEDSSR